MRSLIARTPRGRSVDVGLGMLVAVAAVIVQPVGVMLRQPFWVDEAWVADLVKIPLSRQISLSSSTPIGWALLLRLVPGDGAERLRLVPLGFSVLAVVVAFVFVRGLDWRSASEARAAAVFAAAAVVFSPSSLQQNDLKQYSADAALALLVLLAVHQAGARHDRSGLVKLGVVSVFAMPFSSVVAFVAAAGFAGLLVTAVLEKQAARAREVLIAGGATGIALAAYIAAVIAPHQNRALRDYWRTFYLDGSPGHIISTSGHRFFALHSSFGVAPAFVLGFFVIGLLTLVARRGVAAAVTVVVLWLEMFALGVVDRYPFLDTRTSHFLLVVTVVVAAVGYAAIVTLLVRPRAPVLTAAVVVAIALLAFGVRDQVRTFQFPREDVRTQTLYVAHHQRSDDVVVVNLLANWGFTYYWPGAGTRVFAARTANAAGFLARVDGVNAVFAGGRGRPDLIGALRTALAKQRALGGHGRIWIVRTHLIGGEASAWTEALARLHLRAVATTRGAEPLLVVDPDST